MKYNISNEIFHDSEFRENSLSVALGSTLKGNHLIVDLEENYHFIVGGQNLSELQACKKGIVTSLAVKNSPSELKLIFVNTRGGLDIFTELPHTAMKNVRDAAMGLKALNWCVDQLETRGNGKTVIVIDELEDLMNFNARETVAAIKKIAAKGHRAGIHMIITTSNPIPSVLHAGIRTNIVTRVAFQVEDYTESMMLLDKVGANSLLGNGEMIFRDNDGFYNGNNVVRVQDAEIMAMVEQMHTEYERAQEIALEMAEVGLDSTDSEEEVVVPTELLVEAA